MNKNLNIDIFSVPHSIAIINDWLNEELRLGLKSINCNDIIPSYAPIFRILEQCEGKCAIGKLADRSQKSKPYITQMIKVLETSGYVEKIPDMHDKRISYVHLTEKGWKAQSNISLLIEKIVSENFNSFNQEELQILAILLNKVSNIFK